MKSKIIRWSAGVLSGILISTIVLLVSKKIKLSPKLEISIYELDSREFLVDNNLSARVKVTNSGERNAKNCTCSLFLKESPKIKTASSRFSLKPNEDIYTVLNLKKLKEKGEFNVSMKVTCQEGKLSVFAKAKKIRVVECNNPISIKNAVYKGTRYVRKFRASPMLINNCSINLDSLYLKIKIYPWGDENNITEVITKGPINLIANEEKELKNLSGSSTLTRDQLYGFVVSIYDKNRFSKEKHLTTGQFKTSNVNNLNNGSAAVHAIGSGH